MSDRTARLDWQSNASDWPNHSASRFVSAGGIEWHLQSFGTAGPRALLLHGTAASTHSWARLAPILAHRFEVIAPDLPGHAFTSRSVVAGDMSLGGMANRLGALIDQLQFEPDIVVGHSAGAAILVRMCLDGAIEPRVIVSLNGALLPFGSMGRYMFPALARLLFQNPLTPRIFSWRARDPKSVARVIAGTGSKLSDQDMDFYVRLFQDPAHVAAALAMMANWDLPGLERELPKLRTPLVLIAASEDKAVPPEKALEVERLAPNAHFEYVRGLGHLAHEEDPERIGDLIVAIARRYGVLRDASET